LKEYSNQKHLLTQLKQSILQEAIQGKLTADWRAKMTLSGAEMEPASELLKRIKAEKAQLIKEKKIKKEKPLPPITKEEIPFELPEGWVWCRLGEITTIKGGKRVSSGYKLLKTPTNHIYIRVTDMKNGSINDDNIHYIDSVMFEKIKNYTISKDDLYVTIAGTIGEVGIIPEKFDNMNLTENAAKFVFNNDFIDKLWLRSNLRSNFIQAQFTKKTKKKTAQPKLALTRIATSILPIPPLSEQKEIVKKVEALMQHCQELEQEIETSEANAQMLMQAVLKEAFEGGSKKDVV
jgi:type I restriction enzyme S subunit